MNIQFDWEFVDDAQEGTRPANRRGRKLTGHNEVWTVGVPRGRTKEPEVRGRSLLNAFATGLSRAQRCAQTALARMRTSLRSCRRPRSALRWRIRGNVLKRLYVATLRGLGIRP
jgi:hypothetical protein